MAAVLALAAVIIAPWEGKRNDPYLDIVGVPTVCYGETNVQMRRYTDAECEGMLARSIQMHLSDVERCIHRPLTVKQWAAVASWTYNVGAKAACNSTLVRQINAGLPASTWCRQLLRWNRAGGRVVRGLTNRRQAEYRVCVQ